jgi:hypothetical protein
MKTTGLNLFLIWVGVALGTITAHYVFGTPLGVSVMMDRIMTAGWTIGIVWIDLVLLNRRRS